MQSQAIASLVTLASSSVALVSSTRSPPPSRAAVGGMDGVADVVDGAGDGAVTVQTGDGRQTVVPLAVHSGWGLFRDLLEVGDDIHHVPLTECPTQETLVRFIRNSSDDLARANSSLTERIIDLGVAHYLRSRSFTKFAQHLVNDFHDIADDFMNLLRNENVAAPATICRMFSVCDLDTIAYRLSMYAFDVYLGLTGEERRGHKEAVLDSQLAMIKANGASSRPDTMNEFYNGITCESLIEYGITFTAGPTCLNVTVTTVQHLPRGLDFRRLQNLTRLRVYVPTSEGQQAASLNLLRRFGPVPPPQVGVVSTIQPVVCPPRLRELEVVIRAITLPTRRDYAVPLTCFGPAAETLRSVLYVLIEPVLPVDATEFSATFCDALGAFRNLEHLCVDIRSRAFGDRLRLEWHHLVGALNQMPALKGLMLDGCCLQDGFLPPAAFESVVADVCVACSNLKFLWFRSAALSPFMSVQRCFDLYPALERLNTRERRNMPRAHDFTASHILRVYTTSTIVRLEWVLGDPVDNATLSIRGLDAGTGSRRLTQSEMQADLQACGEISSLSQTITVAIVIGGVVNYGNADLSVTISSPFTVRNVLQKIGERVVARLPYLSARRYHHMDRLRERFYFLVIE